MYVQKIRHEGSEDTTRWTAYKALCLMMVQGFSLFLWLTMIAGNRIVGRTFPVRTAD